MHYMHNVHNFYKLFLLSLISLLVGCGHNHVVDLHYNKAQYIKKIENLINKMTNSTYGDVILKYDLINLGNDEPYDYRGSALFRSIIDFDDMNKAAFEKKIYLLEKAIHHKAKTTDLLKLAENTIVKRYDYFKKIAQKLPINKKIKANFVNKNHHDIFINIKTSSARQNKLKDLEFIKKYIVSAPLITPMKNAKITSKFGYRIDPIKKKKLMHQGLDMQSTKNNNVYATGNGIVKFSGVIKGYGRIVIINHYNGYETYYGHLNQIFVTTNSKVIVNQLIATEGKTGRATGDHLHYEIRYNNIPNDPLSYFTASTN